MAWDKEDRPVVAEKLYGPARLTGQEAFDRLGKVISKLSKICPIEFLLVNQHYNGTTTVMDMAEYARERVLYLEELAGDQDWAK